MAPKRPPRVAVIGPCTSGKTTLADGLRARGISAVSIAQEHTLVADLYRHARPDLLVYLDVSYEEAARRRRISWGPDRLEEQKRFMAPARAAADLVIDTDGVSAREVLEMVLRHLRGGRAAPD